MQNRIFAVYKPYGPSSNKILSYVRQLTHEKHVGHAGTLDPIAEGVLVVGIGREATKKLTQALQKEKEYVATIHLGETSRTDDQEGEKRPHAVKKIPSTDDVAQALLRFKGTILQVPPIFSALKVGGKRAYKMARAGDEPVLKARPAEVRTIDLLEYKWPNLSIRVTTGPGVYVRALARDIGEELKTGGYLASLVRTRVGEFNLEQAIKVDDLEKYLGRHMLSTDG